MKTKSKNIPVNTLPDEIDEGIIISRGSYNGLPNFAEVERSHRDNGHSFILQEKGATEIEIDFQKYEIEAPSIIYINPNQVHRLIGFNDATIGSLMISNENLQPEFLKILDGLTPVYPIVLAPTAFTIFYEAISLML